MTLCSIKAPGKGWIGSLAEAPDAVFANRVMGDGLLLDPTEGKLWAPCAGEILSVARTKHAITLWAQGGAEILMHVGIDTVALDGDGFVVHAKEGQKVEAGDLLLSFDLEILAARAKSLLTPIIVMNGDEYEIINRCNEGVVTTGDLLMELRTLPKPGDNSPASEERAQTVARATTIPLAHGIHARPAARLVEITKKFKAKITVSTGTRCVNARSIVSLMGLGLSLGDEVVVTATGLDAEPAVEEIMAQISDGLGEKPVPIPAPRVTSSDTLIESAAKIEPVALDGSASIQGTPGAPGLIVGKIVQLKSRQYDFPETGAGSAEERSKLLNGIAVVRRRLKDAAIAAEASQQDVLMAHLEILEDPELIEGANTLIKNGKSAEFAWHAVSCDQATLLSSLNDPRMQERADDLLDLQMQVLAVLSGKSDEADQQIAKGTIVIAEQLLPSQFVRLADANVGGVCIVGGGPTSHVCILAADKGIPVLVACEPGVRTIADGTSVILEADRGQLHVAPPLEKCRAIEQAIAKRQQNQSAARECAHEICQTADGVRIEVFANLGARDEAAGAVQYGAEGCGLLRSEFLFLGRATPPDEEEQCKAYQAIADELDGRPLIVRTLDIGGDKPVPYIDIPMEENPALGQRGIRISLRNPELLKTQFRAILQVQSSDMIQIMLPMVVTSGEVLAARKILDEARAELGITKAVSMGVMIETPASAVLADGLAKDADFFSIGTNDLTQYVLAMDRGNAALAEHADGLHPAVLRMIKTTAQAGAAQGKKVSLCGALASDLVALPVLIGLGIARVSTTGARVPDVKAIIRTLTYGDCQKMAHKAINLSAASEVRDHVCKKWPHLNEWA